MGSAVKQPAPEEAVKIRHYPDRIPDLVWAPTVAGLILLCVGLLSLLTGQPWLFASLGPTAVMVAETPEQPGARFYNIVVGHSIGLAVGMMVVILLHAIGIPYATTPGRVLLAEVLAAFLSVSLTLFFGLLARGTHPPAAATTLLMALGIFHPDFHDAFAIIVGVLIVAVLGEFFRRIRVGRISLRGLGRSL